MGLRRFLLGIPWKEKTPSQKVRAVALWTFMFFAFPFPMIAPIVLGMSLNEFWEGRYERVLVWIMVICLGGGLIVALALDALRIGKKIIRRK